MKPWSATVPPDPVWRNLAKFQVPRSPSVHKVQEKGLRNREGLFLDQAVEDAAAADVMFMRSKIFPPLSASCGTSHQEHALCAVEAGTFFFFF